MIICQSYMYMKLLIFNTVFFINSPKLEKVGEAHFFACHRAKELGFVDEK